MANRRSCWQCRLAGPDGADSIALRVDARRAGRSGITSGSLDFSSCVYRGRTWPTRPMIDEPEKRDSHGHCDRCRGAAGLVVLLFQRRHPRLQARRHLGGDVPDQRRQRQERTDRRPRTAAAADAEQGQRRHRQLRQDHHQVPQRLRRRPVQRAQQPRTPRSAPSSTRAASWASCWFTCCRCCCWSACS